MRDLRFSCHQLRVLWLVLLLGVGVDKVDAALGQAPSIPAATFPVRQASGAKMLALNRTVQTTSYTRHEVLLENGTLINEYETSAGLVFAVSWRGPLLPDLSSLLGGYFQAFKVEAEQLRFVGRRGSPINIETDKLVVRSNGRMRNFFGHAYAPDLIPSGVAIKDVLY